MSDRQPRPPSAVTRTEVLDHVLGAFVTPPTCTEDLIERALRTQARIEVIDLLRQLPSRHFGRTEDLWDELPPLPGCR
jgi:hypothetical protein